MKTKTKEVIRGTWSWLEKVVIGLNLCPFAKPAFDSNRIGAFACPLNELEENIALILEGLNQGIYETSLLALEEAQGEELDFESFYQLCAGIEEGLELACLEEHFQIVVFHPRFRFEGLGDGDLANLVNRSPYPTIHFLKTASMKALELSPGQGEEVSKRNEELLKSMSEEQLRELFPWVPALSG